MSEISLGKVSMRPYLKNKLKIKRTGDMLQVLECLLSKHEVLS
jgi:hypothetical protein